MDNAQIRTQPDTHPHTLGWTSTARANIFVDFISKSHYQMVSLWGGRGLVEKGGGLYVRGCQCVCVRRTYLPTQTHGYGCNKL